MQCVWLAIAQAAYFYIQDGNACYNVWWCWCPNLYTTDSYCYRVCALKGLAGHFGKVQTGFLQLLLTQTWVKRTSLNSSRCVVYSSTRFKAIRAASKKLEQDEWWKIRFSSVHLVVLLLIYYYFLYKFFQWTIGLRRRRLRPSFFGFTSHFFKFLSFHALYAIDGCLVETI